MSSSSILVFKSLKLIAGLKKVIVMCVIEDLRMC